MAIVLLCLAPHTGSASVIVARVDQNGSCRGLLQQGDRILFLNGTPIETTQDVHDFIAGTKPGQTVILTTETENLLVHLGGTETGKLGIGIINLNRSLLYDEETYVPTSTPEPSPAGVDESRFRLPAGIVLSIVLGVFLLVLLSLRDSPLHGALSRIDSSLEERGSDLSRCVSLFVLAAAARVGTNVAYFIRYGSHATNVMELWFYVDVANGNRYFLNPLNPTVHILRLFAILSPEETPFYSTVVCSILLASAAPVLLYFLMKETHGPKVGFLSGLIYALLVQPLALSTASFTQHLTQIPVALIFLLFLRRAARCRGMKQAMYVLILLPIALIGYLINVEIFVYVAIGYLMISVAVIRWLLADKGIDGGKSFASLMLAMGLISIPLYLYFDDLMSLSASLTPKDTLVEEETQPIHVPSATFVTGLPLPVSSYFRLYGIYLLLMPFGVYMCWRKRDPLPFLLLIFGIAIGLNMSRASRISDLGIAMLAGLALSAWRNEWDLTSLFIMIIVAAASLSLFPKSNLQPYFLIATLALMATVAIRRIPSKGLVAVTVGISYCISTFVVGVIIADPVRSTQAEFEALDWLGQNSELGERILTSLDRGHLPNAIANLDSVSDEYSHRLDIAKAFYETERLAAVTLMEQNVSYVMVSTDDLIIGKDQAGRPALSTRGYATFDHDLGDREIPLTLVFRLTYPDEGLLYFDEVCRRVSEETTVRIYRVRDDLLRERIERPDPSGRVTLSVVLWNPNSVAVTTKLMVNVVDSSGNTRILDSVRVVLDPSENRSLGVDYESKPLTGMEVEVSLLGSMALRTGGVAVRGSVEAETAGLYLFDYGLSNSQHQQIVDFLEEGVNDLTHWLNDNRTPEVVSSLSISPFEHSSTAIADTARVVTPLALNPPQILFYEID